MKLDWNRKYTTIAVYAFLVAAAILLFYSFLENNAKFQALAAKVLSMLMPVIYGLVFAYLLNPILRFFDKKAVPKVFKKIRPKLRRGLSIFCTYFVALAFLALFSWLVIPQVVTSLTSIVGKIPTYVNSLDIWVQGLLTRLPWLNDVAVNVVQKLLDSAEQLLSASYELLSTLLPKLLVYTQQITQGVIHVAVGLIISIYLLMSKEKFFAQIKKFLSAILDTNKVERLVYVTHKTNKVFSGFIYGKLVDSLIIGVLCFIGMSIFGWDYTILISFVVGVTNVIPYFGPFIGAIPSALILLLSDPMQAFWFLIFILVLQQIDGNIIGPKILGENLGLSAFWVVFSILVFGELMGPVGMFIGVPVFAVIYILIREWTESRLKHKGLPVKTSSYASEEHKIEY